MISQSLAWRGRTRASGGLYADRVALSGTGASPSRRAQRVPAAIPWSLECSYYGAFLYSGLAVALGVHVSLLAPAMLAVLGAISLSYGSSHSRAYARLAAPLSFAISYIAVQLLAHGESLMADAVRPYVPWVFTVIILQTLLLRRGFPHRFALVTFLFLLTTLPSLMFRRDGQVLRAGLDATVFAIANPNDLAAWFGFCCVYFTIYAVGTKRRGFAAASWLIVIVCLYGVALSVSRGALLAVAISATLATRRLLRRGFVPLLLLATGAWIVYGIGLFDEPITAYATRGSVETGRLKVWPVAIARCLDSPFFGVGGSHLETYVPSMNQFITPHNTFIAIALASGVIPLALFGAYCVRAALGALRGTESRLADRPFRIPLLVYVLLLMTQGTGVYMAPWGILILLIAAGGGESHGRRLRLSYLPSAGTQRQRQARAF